MGEERGEGREKTAATVIYDLGRLGLGPHGRVRAGNHMGHSIVIFVRNA